MSTKSYKVWTSDGSDYSYKLIEALSARDAAEKFARECTEFNDIVYVRPNEFGGALFKYHITVEVKIEVNIQTLV